MNSEESLDEIYLQYLNLKSLIIASGIEWDEMNEQLDRLAATIEAAQCRMVVTIHESLRN